MQTWKHAGHCLACAGFPYELNVFLYRCANTTAGYVSSSWNSPKLHAMQQLLRRSTRLVRFLVNFCMRACAFFLALPSLQPPSPPGRSGCLTILTFGNNLFLALFFVWSSQSGEDVSHVRIGEFYVDVLWSHWPEHSHGDLIELHTTTWCELRKVHFHVFRYQKTIVLSGFSELGDGLVLFHRSKHVLAQPRGARFISLSVHARSEAYLQNIASQKKKTTCGTRMSFTTQHVLNVFGTELLFCRVSDHQTTLRSCASRFECLFMPLPVTSKHRAASDLDKVMKVLPSCSWASGNHRRLSTEILCTLAMSMVQEPQSSPTSKPSSSPWLSTSLAAAIAHADRTGSNTGWAFVLSGPLAMLSAWCKNVSDLFRNEPLACYAWVKWPYAGYSISLHSFCTTSSIRCRKRFSYKEQFLRNMPVWTCKRIEIGCEASVWIFPRMKKPFQPL